MSTIKLRDFFAHYAGEPHQVAAVEQLQAAMPQSLLQSDSPWVETFRAAPKAKEPLVPQQQNGALLKVPYFSQRDSVMAEQALRMCFSSSCAMLLATLKPGSIAGPAADDQYLKRVMQYGDTTDAGAQIKALASYGVKARLVQNANWGTLEQQLQKGIPVPCGFLHHGSVHQPTGGGHWLCVIGITDKATIANDPFGEMDVVKGTYVNTKGAGVVYSKANWGPRWMVEGPSTGWAILAER
jgi:hypothetical protein